MKRFWDFEGYEPMFQNQKNNENQKGEKNTEVIYLQPDCLTWKNSRKKNNSLVPRQKYS